MIDAQWWWGYSDDGGFYGPYDTRDIAIAQALIETDEGFYVCQASRHDPQKLSDYFRADTFLEDADLEADELLNPDGDDPLFDLTDEQTKDLQAVVRAAIDAWQERRKLVFYPWAFKWQGEVTWIEGQPE